MTDSTDRTDHERPPTGADAGDAVPVPHGVRRQFIGWDRPVVEAAATWFLEHAVVRDGAIEAADEVWIFSGSRGGREFLRRIREAAGRRGLAIEPPRVATPGRFADAMAGVLPIELVPASDLERRNAWANAVLAAAKRDALHPLLDRPRATPQAAWSLADRLIDAVDELRGEGIGPEAFAETLDDDGERWIRIAAVEREVRERLSAAGLVEPHDHREALIDAVSASVDPDRRRVVSAGVLEWSGWQRRLLAAAEAEVLVAAPPDRSEAFDRFGAVEPEGWVGAEIELGDDVVTTAATVHDATEIVLDEIANRSIDAGIDGITIGVADDELLPTMLRAARGSGLPVHAAPIEPLSASAPGRAIELLRDLVETDAADRVAALLRHPHVAASLADDQGDDLPGECTALFAERLPRRLEDLIDACDREPLRRRSGDREEATAARGRLKASLTRLADLCEAWTGAPRAASGWANASADWLAKLYSGPGEDRSAEPDAAAGEQDPADLADLAVLREDLAACADLLRGFASLPESVDGPISGLAFLDRLLERMRHARRNVGTSGGDEVEAVGWLELAADPAPHLVVLGLHDGAVPGAASTDPLLTESVRERLGLATQRRRLARDTAILAGLAHRFALGGSLRIVVPQRSIDGTSLLPSRLLLGGEGEVLARRTLSLAGGGIAHASPDAPADVSGFVTPEPNPDTPLPERLSITAIRTYLADPYRFHLRHVERLEEAVEGGGEMDARTFGTFAHAVVESASRLSEWATATDGETLAELLEAALSDAAAARFGGRPAASVRVQLRSLRRRVRALAEVEARSRDEGWRTEQVEAWLDASLTLGPGEPPQRFSGRIDRIDRHLESDRIRILDYKTGDRAADPAKAHRRGRAPDHRWIDLQLPLYRHLHAVQHGLDETTVGVGYVTLATGPRGVDVRMLSEWSEDEFAEAIEKAREVVRAIRNREFASPGPAAHPDEFSNLCGEPVLVDGAGAGAGAGGSQA